MHLRHHITGMNFKRRTQYTYLCLCEECWPSCFDMWYLWLFLHYFFPPHGKCGCHGVVNQCPIRMSLLDLTLYEVPLFFLTWCCHSLRWHRKKVGFRSPWFFQFTLLSSSLSVSHSTWCLSLMRRHRTYTHARARAHTGTWTDRLCLAANKW